MRAFTPSRLSAHNDTKKHLKNLHLVLLSGFFVLATACAATGDNLDTSEPSATGGNDSSASGGSSGEGSGGKHAGGSGSGGDDGIGGTGGEDTGGDGTGGQGIAEPELPKFAYRMMLVDRQTASYNPTQEFIFSSVIETTHIPEPLGRYYLYYAPHDYPGGISLAYADDVEGPWTEYAENPLISNKHQGRFAVTHVSSPHVLWMEQYDKYFLYFHGENTTTRWAHSTDGITWDLAEDNVALTTADWFDAFGSKTTVCSYARVFEYAILGIDDPYTMMMMLHESGHGNRIGLATSTDGKHFTPRDSALITPAEGEGSSLSSAFYYPLGNHHYVLYHGASGNIYYTDVGAAFDREDHLGVFLEPGPSYPEYAKAAAPFILHTNDRRYLFYDVGQRHEQSIALAVEQSDPSVILDQGDAEFSVGGSWNVSASTEGYYGANYLVDDSEEANPNTWAKWIPNLPQAGSYRVYVRFPAAENRPDNIKYKVYHQGTVDEVFVDQTTNNGSWVELGSYEFGAGSSEDNKVTLDAASDTGFAVADAVWFAFNE